MSKYTEYFKNYLYKRNKLNPEYRAFYRLKYRSKERGNPLLITQFEFYSWYRDQIKKCSYCDLPDHLKQKQNLNFNSRKQIAVAFSIDRKNSKLPYSIENICLSCFTCNRLKSDYFTYDEFREIAQKYIKPKWASKGIKSSYSII